jgi:hypothetical protein
MLQARLLPGNHRPQFQFKFGVSKEEADGLGEGIVERYD